MAKLEREEEFEVREVAPLHSLSSSLAFSYGRLHSPLSVQCYCTTIFTNIVLLYNDFYQAFQIDIIIK